VSLTITPLQDPDVDALATAFASWPKDREVFERYRTEVRAGERDVLVAALDGEVAGYATIRWRSPYPVFVAAGIPEIQDFNVLADRRRRGIGTALMNAAEQAIVSAGYQRAGIGVGLYADYGAAQRLYVKRGYIPDGAGIMVGTRPPRPGTTVRVDDDLVLMFTKALG
jgi:GNAT superfamily N-acetyltransferase